jgi:hypothetical protein
LKRNVFASGSSEAEGSATFERVLDEVERSDDRAPWAPRGGRPPGRPFATFAGPIDPGPASGGSNPRWERALEWIAEPPEFVAAPAAAALSDNPDSIAAELGLTRAHTREQLKRARRRFMWENHPDRRLDAPRDLANRRVAIANMLIDRAEQALRKDGAP